MVFIFILSWVLLFIVAVRLMIRGLSIDPQRDVDLSYKVEKRTVTKMPHPEMTDVKQGDELLVVRFDEPEKEIDPRFKLDSPELHNLGDPLHKSLQDRIDELNEDDDDEGGLIVRRWNGFRERIWFRTFTL